MIMDSLLLFSDAQAVTSAAASDSVVDLGSARNIGVGEDLYIVAILDVAMADTGSDSTLAVALEGDSTSSFTPDSTITLFTFAAISAIGTKKVAKVPPDFMNLRFARLKYTPAGGDLSAGSITAFVTHDPDQYTSYADGITIS